VLLRVTTDGPNGVDQVEDSPTKVVNVTAATFSDFFNQAVAFSNCTDCHGSVAPASGLDWNGPPSAARARLVNVASGCNGGSFRVVPNFPFSSTVFGVLNSSSDFGNCDSMRSNLPDPVNDVDVLRSWILGGALNN
jgi:hypothetical protein